MKKVLSIVFICTLLLSSVFAQGFSYGKPQASICISNIDDMLAKVEELSTLFRFPMLKSQAKILMKSWIGTRDKTFIDTTRKLAVLVYSPVELKEKSAAVVFPIKHTDELLKKLDYLFDIKIEKGKLLAPAPFLFFRMTDNNIVVSANKKLLEELTDEEITKQLSFIKPQSSLEFQVNLQEVIKAVLKQMPFTQMVEGQIEELKAQMKGHPQEEVIVNWLDSCKTIVFSLVEGIDKIVVGGIDCKDHYGLSLRIDVIPGSKISNFFKQASDKKMTLITAFPEKYLLIGGSNVNVAPQTKEFVKGMFTFAEVLFDAQFGANVPPPAKALIKKVIDLFVFSIENVGNEDALGVYKKDDKAYVIYGAKMNSSDMMVKKLEEILFGVKEMAKEFMPPNVLAELEGKKLGTFNGKEVKALFSIPVGMLKQMMAKERELKQVINPEKLDKYFGNYIHIGLFDAPGFLFFGLGGDDLVKELELIHKGMAAPKKSLPFTAFVSYDLKKFLKKPFQLGIKDMERNVARKKKRLEDIKKKGGDRWEERWARYSLKRREAELKTLTKIYNSFNKSFQNGIKIKESYILDENGMKFSWALPNEVLKDAGDLLAEFIALVMKQEIMKEFSR